MKKTQIAIISLEFILIIILLILYLNKSEAYDSINTEYGALMAENRKLQSFVDSVKAAQAAIPVYNSEDNRNPEILNLIENVNKGWNQMSIKKDPQELLQYFMPRHSTNEVFINTENLPQVEQHNNRDLRTHLQALVEAGDVIITTEKPQVFKIFVRDNIFTAMYLIRLNVYRAEEVVHSGTVLVALSGEKIEGEWKVGNASWIEFQYFD